MTPRPLHRSLTLWLGLFSLAFLIFARIGSQDRDAGIRWGSCSVRTEGNRVILDVLVQSTRAPSSSAPLTMNTWNAPREPDGSPPPRAGYHRSDLAYFIMHSLVLPYRLLICIDLALLALLLFLRQRRHTRYRATLRDLEIATIPTP